VDLVRWALGILTATAGCNQVLGLDHTALAGPDAAIDAVGCSAAKFVNPTLVPSNAIGSSNDSYDPTISSDLHELWFSKTNGNNHDLAVAIESGGRYDTVDFPAQLNTTSEETDPALSADGLDLMFVSDRVGNNDRLFEATRPTRDDPFGAPSLVASLSSEDFSYGFDLSVDGLSVYYQNRSNDSVYVVARPNRGAAFSLPTLVGTGVQWPGISPDQREVFYVNGNLPPGVYRKTRADTTSAFGDVDELVDGTLDDPDVTPDAMTMIAVVRGTGGFELLHRVCQ
jgi:hypothetical protein